MKVLPALMHGCETWDLTKEELKDLICSQLMIIRLVLKIPSSIPKPTLLGAIGELPIKQKVKGEQLMYLHSLLTSKTRTNDIEKIQTHEYSTNQTYFLNKTFLMSTNLKKYNINENTDNYFTKKMTMAKYVPKKNERRRRTQNI